VVNVSLSCQLERAGIGCFVELKLEVTQLLATDNSCKLTEKWRQLYYCRYWKKKGKAES
jgi:hypothetical protein